MRLSDVAAWIGLASALGALPDAALTRFDGLDPYSSGLVPPGHGADPQLTGSRVGGRAGRGGPSSEATAHPAGRNCSATPRTTWPSSRTRPARHMPPGSTRCRPRPPSTSAGTRNCATPNGSSATCIAPTPNSAASREAARSTMPPASRTWSPSTAASRCAAWRDQENPCYRAHACPTCEDRSRKRCRICGAER